MPKVHTVQKARKAIPSAGIAVGDKYYWWKFRFGGKRVSRVYPKPSQLTQSDFLSQYYALQEGLVVGDDQESTAQAMRDAAESLRELSGEQEDKLSNMPDALQQGSTGELLQERADSCNATADELDAAADELDGFDPAGQDEGADAKNLGEMWRDEAERLLGNIDWGAE